MDEATMKLFNSSNDNVVLPSVNEKVVQQQEQLMSADIQGAISGDTVKKLLLPESSKIDPCNFSFDFSEMQSVTVFQREALKSLGSKKESKQNVSLYLYRKDGLVKFGMGEKYSLEREIPLLRHFIFGDEIRVYKNYVEGEPIVEVTGRDVTQMRLNL